MRLCKAKAGEYVYGTGDDHAPKEEVMQPMVSKDAVDRMASLVKDATDKVGIRSRRISSNVRV